MADTEYKLPEGLVNGCLHAGGAIITYARCESCMYGSCFTPTQRHSWAGPEDIQHAQVTGQDVEKIKAQVCACECATPPTDTDEKGGCEPRRIADVLADAHLTFVSEDDLQAGISSALAAVDIEAQREVRLSDGVSRIDVLAGTVGIEVKIAGGWADVVRQLTRYAKCEEISALVLVTSRAKHHNMPAELRGKPVHVVSLIGSGL